MSLIEKIKIYNLENSIKIENSNIHNKIELKNSSDTFKKDLNIKRNEHLNTNKEKIKKDSIFISIEEMWLMAGTFLILISMSFISYEKIKEFNAENINENKLISKKENEKVINYKNKINTIYTPFLNNIKNTDDYPKALKESIHNITNENIGLYGINHENIKYKETLKIIEEWN